ncbi:hypothetical protein SprV_0301384500 [Sparganum proliferum]
MCSAFSSYPSTSPAFTVGAHLNVEDYDEADVGKNAFDSVQLSAKWPIIPLQTVAVYCIEGLCRFSAGSHESDGNDPYGGFMASLEATPALREKAKFQVSAETTEVSASADVRARVEHHYSSVTVAK